MTQQAQNQNPAPQKTSTSVVKVPHIRGFINGWYEFARKRTATLPISGEEIELIHFKGTTPVEELNLISLLCLFGKEKLEGQAMQNIARKTWKGDTPTPTYRVAPYSIEITKKQKWAIAKEIKARLESKNPQKRDFIGPYDWTQRTITQALEFLA